MTEQEVIESLTKEGFTDVYTWEDQAGTKYPEHTHEKLTAHVILTGEMILIDKNGEKTLKAGERFDIPQGTVHKAKMGPEGCRYVIGER
jgi:quercetin dioxygenase-like cupin family protein